MLKDSVVVVRVSDELKDKISDKAEKLGLSSSAYIRTLVIKDLE
jgi:antitoxin component of RelBE/YafQ-DinJ toxin-antitoxin module